MINLQTNLKCIPAPSEDTIIPLLLQHWLILLVLTQTDYSDPRGATLKIPREYDDDDDLHVR